jgi:hypothetical protein
MNNVKIWGVESEIFEIENIMEKNHIRELYQTMLVYQKQRDRKQRWGNKTLDSTTFNKQSIQHHFTKKKNLKKHTTR